MSSDWHRRVFLRLIASLAPWPFWFSADAPKSVEQTHFDQPARRCFLLCVVRFQQEQPNLPVAPFEVRLAPPDRFVRTVEMAPERHRVTFAQRDGVVSFCTRTLETFQMYRLSYR